MVEFGGLFQIESSMLITKVSLPQAKRFYSYTVLYKVVVSVMLPRPMPEMAAHPQQGENQVSL